jgi:hypothetical protein
MSALDKAKGLAKDWENIALTVSALVEGLYESGALNDIPDLPRWMVILFVLTAILRKRWKGGSDASGTDQ